MLSSPLVRAWEHGHLLQLTGGGHEIFDLTNFASHVCPSGELVSCVISMSSPNFHTNSLYFNHNSPCKLLYYAGVTCDYYRERFHHETGFSVSQFTPVAVPFPFPFPFPFPVPVPVPFPFPDPFPDFLVFHTPT